MINRWRWAKLQNIFKESIKNKKNVPFVQLTESRVLFSFEELKQYHDECVEKGYEGIIIRNYTGMYEFGFRSADLIKYKEFNTDEFKVVDIVEANGRDSGTAIFVLETKDGNTFRAKPQGSRELRSEYFSNPEKIIDKMCTVQYQGLTDAGIPRFPSAIAIRDYE